MTHQCAPVFLRTFLHNRIASIRACCSRACLRHLHPPDGATMKQPRSRKKANYDIFQTGGGGVQKLQSGVRTSAQEEPPEAAEVGQSHLSPNRQTHADTRAHTHAAK